MNLGSTDTDGPGEEALRDALRGRGLAADALQRVRQSVTTEWQQTYGIVPPRRRAARGVWFAVVVALVAAAAGVLSYLRPAPLTVAATVANGLSGSLSARSANQPARRLSAGAPLQQGDEVESTGPGELRWLRGGIVRLKPGARLTIVNDRDIRLTAGAVFVDIAPGHEPGALRILTPFATVEHFGTQFVVAVDGGALAVGVRQGSVRVTGAATTSLAAGDELQLGADGVAHRRHLLVNDPAWHWTGEPLFAFDPEGRSVLELLEWVSQEKGRPLEFAADGLRLQASAIVLHGSIRGLAVDEALALMLATTSLRAAITDDRIDVSATAADPVADRR